MRSLGRAFWWIIVTERPSRPADYLAILALVALAALGAVAIAWPWISTEAPRAVATGLWVVQTTITSWLERLVASLPRLR